MGQKTIQQKDLKPGEYIVGGQTMSVMPQMTVDPQMVLSGHNIDVRINPLTGGAECFPVHGPYDVTDLDAHGAPHFNLKDKNVLGALPDNSMFPLTSSPDMDRDPHVYLTGRQAGIALDKYFDGMSVTSPNAPIKKGPKLDKIMDRCTGPNV